MEKYYCNKCKKDVILRDGVCPSCKTDWEEVISISEDNTDKEENYTIDDEFYQTEEYYCSECGKKVKPNIKKCHHCGVSYVKDEPKIKDEDINQTINYYLKFSKIITIISIIACAILLFAFIGSLCGGDEETAIGCLIGALLTFGEAIFAKHNYRWKAYMLYTNNKK